MSGPLKELNIPFRVPNLWIHNGGTVFQDIDQYPRESRLYIGFLTRLWYKVLSVLVGPEVIQINEYAHNCVSLTTETSIHSQLVQCSRGMGEGVLGVLYWCSCTSTMYIHVFGFVVSESNILMPSTVKSIYFNCFHTVN